MFKSSLMPYPVYHTSLMLIFKYNIMAVFPQFLPFFNALNTRLKPMQLRPFSEQTATSFYRSRTDELALDLQKYTLENMKSCHIQP